MVKHSRYDVEAIRLHTFILEAIDQLVDENTPPFVKILAQEDLLSVWFTGTPVGPRLFQ